MEQNVRTDEDYEAPGTTEAKFQIDLRTLGVSRAHSKDKLLGMQS